MQEGGEVVGFLPFERRSFDRARPAGFPLSDYQGVVCGPDWRPDLPRIVELLRLRSLDFTHLLAGQAPEGEAGWTFGQSPILDLSRGFEAYAQERAARGSNLIRDTDRRQRKLEREVGELRYVWSDPAPEVLEQLISWKKAQYARTKVIDLFDHEWPRALLKGLMSHSDAEFGCFITVLYCRNEIAALEVELRYRDTLHNWFPAYDPELYKYSPGLIMSLELARACQSNGVNYLDLGMGSESYKERFVSFPVPLARGAIVRSRPIRMAREGWKRTRDWLRASPMRPAVEPVIGVARRMRERMGMR